MHTGLDQCIISYKSPSYMISQAVPRDDKTKNDEGDF
jgi:hypothetical protein